MRLEDLLPTFPEEVKLWLVRHGIPLFALKRLQSWSVEECQPLVLALARLDLGQNHVAQILDLLNLVAKKNRESPAIIFQKALDATQDLTGKNRHAAIRDLLQSWRYPQLSQKEATFALAAQELKPPAGVQIKASPYFEGDYCELNVRLHTTEDIRRLAQWLSEADFRKIFDVIK